MSRESRDEKWGMAGHKAPVGELVMRNFDGVMFTGRVISKVIPDPDDADQRPWYKIVYEDGDCEDLARDDVDEGILAAQQATDGSATKPPPAKKSRSGKRRSGARPRPPGAARKRTPEAKAEPKVPPRPLGTKSRPQRPTEETPPSAPPATARATSSSSGSE